MEDSKRWVTQQKLATCTVLVATLISLAQNCLKTQKLDFLAWMPIKNIFETSFQTSASRLSKWRARFFWVIFLRLDYTLTMCVYSTFPHFDLMEYLQKSVIATVLYAIAQCNGLRWTIYDKLSSCSPILTVVSSLMLSQNISHFFVQLCFGYSKTETDLIADRIDHWSSNHIWEFEYQTGRPVTLRCWELKQKHKQTKFILRVFKWKRIFGILWNSVFSVNFYNRRLTMWLLAS